MLKTISCSNCTRMGKRPHPALMLAMAILVGVAFSSTALVPQAMAKKTTKSKKVSARKKALKLKKTRRNARTRRSSGVPRISQLQSSFKKKLNQNTVTLMSGCCTTGAYTAFGADIKDMVRQVGEQNGLRVLPIIGGGAGTNVRDILYLRGIDMAIMNTDVIDYYKGKPLYENLTRRIQYITKLFNEEVHLYAGNGVASLYDLNGKSVGFNNSNAEVTGQILFKKLGIKPRETMRISEGDGALALKEGRLDAMMRVTGKPIRNIDRLKAIFPDIRLLPIAYDPALIGSHLPTQLTHEDYPDLIDKGQVVPTIATRTILAVFNWKPSTERYRRLAKFTTVFFDHFTDLRHSKNLHPKWAEVNLRATVPGMTRFAPAVNWIKAKTAAGKRPDSDKNRTSSADLMKNFKQFLASRAASGEGSSEGTDTEKLFGEFLDWQKQRQ